MLKRIFRSICLVALCVFLASVTLFMGVLYEHFTGVQRRQLRIQTNLAAQGVSHEGIRYFDGLSTEDYRITWISDGGTVLFDSKSDISEMENHLEREEIKQAFSKGTGESTRISATLLERSIYCARRLPDGTVLRLSVAQYTMLTLILGMLQPTCIIFIATLALSFALAFRLSQKIVKPLNELNLDKPFQNDGYDELAPLLRRIASQQRQIQAQEETLQQKQSEFETVTTGMAEGLVLLNAKKIILSMNPAAMRLFDTDASCIGRYLQSVNRSLELQELLWKAEVGKHAGMLLELKGGSYQLEASPVFSDGLVLGIVLLMLDVTEKEKNEQMRREFTANVSHELKTPLHTISGSAELMANGMVKSTDIPQFSNMIYTEAQRMIRLVDDIIRLSRLDEGADDMKPEKVNLYELADTIIQSLSQEAKALGIRMDLSGEVVSVYGIRQLLSGIIYNLCDNAIKYNRENGSVSVTVKKEEDAVLLSVADTGIGIPEEHQERIFERFYRVDKSHSKEIGGTGLGLSIVKHAAKLHHAEIEVKSIVESGTTVTVRFTKILQE